MFCDACALLYMDVMRMILCVATRILSACAFLMSFICMAVFYFVSLCLY